MVLQTYLLHSQTCIQITLLRLAHIGINTTHEQMFFSHYLETHNFDIVGISETKLKESATNFVFKEQAIYKCFWSSNDLEPRGTGVGLLIKNDIAKHIQKVFRLDGR